MKKLDYAIVFVSDMSRSVRFYRDILGLALKFESPKWTEFATEGCTIALHASDKADPTASAMPPPAGRCQLGFVVEKLEDFHHRMEADGVRCLKRPAKTGSQEPMLAIYADPDGMPITVAEKGS